MSWPLIQLNTPWQSNSQFRGDYLLLYLFLTTYQTSEQGRRLSKPLVPISESLHSLNPLIGPPSLSCQGWRSLITAWKSYEIVSVGSPRRCLISKLNVKSFW